MTSKELYMLAEGPDDTRFIDSVLQPILEHKYGLVKTIEYAEMPRKTVRNFLKSFVEMGADYIVTGDLDQMACFPLARQRIQRDLGCDPVDNTINVPNDVVAVVVTEIEGWYLAGLDEQSGNALGMKSVPETTDLITKEQFNDLIPKRLRRPRNDFMIEILKRFSMDIATQERKNKSLIHFVEKYGS